ncbi:MAG: DUF5331 domain-containing protein [Cyanobacteria bacterium J06633_2]
MNTQQTPQSTLSASSSRQFQLRRSLKVKWLTYYRDNRDWLTKLGVWVNDGGARRPSSSFILATLSVLEPRLAQLMPIVVDLNSNADRVVRALGLNFTPDDELKQAIANGLLSADQQALMNGQDSDSQNQIKFLPSTVSEPFVTSPSTDHQIEMNQTSAISHVSPSPMIHSAVASLDRKEEVVQATIQPNLVGRATLQDSVDLYLDHPGDRYGEMDHYQDIDTHHQLHDDPHDEPRSPHEVAAQNDEICSGVGQSDPFQTIRNIDIRI